jgi:hypothetical protein
MVLVHTSTSVFLQLALQIATLLSVIIGFWSLITTIRNARRQMNAQVFMKYTERYEHVLDQFPPDALKARLDTRLLPPQSDKLSLCVLKYLNLCSEEYYLLQRGYLAKDLWSIWELDLRRTVASPVVQREWPNLRDEFVSHPAFLKYVEGIHSEKSPVSTKKD